LRLESKARVAEAPNAALFEGHLARYLTVVPEGKDGT
jgi:hypothetical protein